MRRLGIVLSTAAMVMFVASVCVSAQGKDFTGKWTRDAAAAGAAAGGGGGAAGGGGGARGGGGGGGGRGGGGGGFNCGMSCTITMSGNTLTVVSTGRNGEQTTKFEAAGEATNMGGRDGTTAIKTTGKWDGAKLVLSTARDNNGTTVTGTQTLWLEGGKLVVESNSGMEGATPTKATYTKG